MNLFEAIFVRKSVRSYTNEALAPQMLEDILIQFEEIKGLFGGIETELAIFDNREGQYKMLSILGVKAPYYLILYSEEKDRALMNAGYLMDSFPCILCTRGLGAVSWEIPSSGRSMFVGITRRSWRCWLLERHAVPG